MTSNGWWDCAISHRPTGNEYCRCDVMANMPQCHCGNTGSNPVSDLESVVLRVLRRAGGFHMPAPVSSTLTPTIILVITDLCWRSSIWESGYLVSSGLRVRFLPSALSENVVIAQVAERLASTQEVAGSRPVYHTNVEPVLKACSTVLGQ